MPGASSHVVVFGLDGVRYDSLRAADTPVVDRIAAAGFLAPVLVDDASPTISGPVWATVVTGVLPDRHGIFGNDLTGHRLAEYPDFLARVRAARPGAGTYAASSWAPLVSTKSGGPVFVDGGYLPPGCAVDDRDARERGDAEVAEHAAAVLGRADIAAAFVHFDAPDSIAHRVGVGDEYRRGIELTDCRVGQVLAAIDARESRASERWTVIALTDHGHRAAGGHGGDSPAERTAWLAAAGDGVPTAPPDWLAQADVAAHALSTLDIPVSVRLSGAPFDRASSTAH